VLFPGSTIPLHIFEPRYRRLLIDCVESDRRFGIALLAPGTPERELPRGVVGTVAHIESVEMLDDGRANIVVTGTERFAFERFVEADRQYHVAEVSEYSDFPEPGEALLEESEELRDHFYRVARAAHRLTDDDAEPPQLPHDPALISFAVASFIDLGAEERQRILAERAPLARIQKVTGILLAAVEPLERRAEVHSRAKSNGGGPARHS
jgi:Lon protease-like protein